MRPKKKILLVDVNENRAALMRFMLRTNGFAVQTAATVDEARIAVSEWVPDLAVVAWPPLGISRHVPMLLLAPKETEGTLAIYSDRTLFNANSRDILDAAKQMCARKRGPKPGMTKPVQSVQVAAIEEVSHAC